MNAQAFRNLYVLEVEINSDPENNVNSITIFSPSGLASSLTFSLPNDEGTSSEYLTTNGSGTITWNELSGSGGSIAGSNTQIQFNNNSSFGANPNFVWDESNTRLGIGNPSLAFTVDINGSALIGNDGQDGELRLFTEAGFTDYYTGFRPTTLMTQSTTYTWPSTYGTDGQFLVTDGIGNLSFIDDAVGGSFNCSGQGTGGGSGNTADGGDSFIGGRADNTVEGNGSDSMIGGGNNNNVEGDRSTIISGSNNKVESAADESIIGAGTSNFVDGDEGGIMAGYSNNITELSDESMIGAGSFNFMDADDGGIIAGTRNQIGFDTPCEDADDAFVGAGQDNYNNQGDLSSIVAGTSNTMNGNFDDSSIGGGNQNSITDEESFIGAGQLNLISINEAAIGGGFQNVISGQRSSILGGSSNTVTGEYSLAFGRQSEANADYTVALGRRAVADDLGCFVFADGNDSEVNSNGTTGRFTARFSNGYRFYTEGDLSVFVGLTPGCSNWGTCSDSSLKEFILEQDPSYFYNNINSMPVSTWSYKTNNNPLKRNYGPMAQDFYNYFGHDSLGEIGSSTRINIIDLTSVGILSIQEIKKQNEIIEKEIKKELTRNNKLEKELSELEKQLILLEEELIQRNKNLGQK